MPIREFRFWCQKVLPLVYDDSLSYYEVLNKMVEYINMYREDLGILSTEYARLTEYVNDYFDNLDVQEEVNNVIQSMVDSGAFGDIVNPLVVDATSDWLEDNVTPTGSAVLVDASLSVSGAAADAKVTGDEISDLKSDFTSFNTKPIFVQGGIGSSNGATNTVGIAIRTTEPIDKGIQLVTCDGNYRIRAYCYNTQGGYLGYYYNGELIKYNVDTGYQRTLNITDLYSFESVDKIYICLLKIDIENPARWLDIIPEESVNIHCVTNAKSKKDIDFNTSVFSDVNVIYNTYPEIIQGNIDNYLGYYKNNSHSASGASGLLRACCKTFVRMNDKYFKTIVPNGYSVGILLYGDNNFPSYITTKTWKNTQEAEWYITEDYKYLYFVFKRNDNEEITATDLENLNAGFKVVRPCEYNTPFYGLKMASLGDSITYGFIPRNYTGYPGRLKSFTELTALLLGMSYYNYGISGSSVAYISGRDPMSRRYNELPNDADVITFMGGTNDIRNGVELGNMSDRTDSTFYGALHTVLSGLYKKYFIDQGTQKGTRTKIIVVTPLKLLLSSAAEQGGTGVLYDFEPWINAIKEVAKYYSFPVLDLYNDSYLNPALNETIQGYETGYTGFYNPYLTDGTHPTQEAAKIMADLLVGFLKTLK